MRELAPALVAKALEKPVSYHMRHLRTPTRGLQRQGAECGQPCPARGYNPAVSSGAIDRNQPEAAAGVRQGCFAPQFDRSAVARSLARVGSGPSSFVDAFFERVETCSLALDTREETSWSPRLQREEGFGVRLCDDRSWLGSRDVLDTENFLSACRQVARRQPNAPLVIDDLVFGPWPELESAQEIETYPASVEAALREIRVGFPMRMDVTRHRRWIQVIGDRLVPDPEAERFYSIAATIPGGRYGILLDALAGSEAAVARALANLFRAREAEPPAAEQCTVVFGPAASAVLLHETVAHLLECDTLAESGRPSAASGVELGSSLLDVVDDATSAPAGLRRVTDDEGMPIDRRWLLRRGVVEQPLADRAWSSRDEGLHPGCARRSSRHAFPVPRSYHLELLEGDQPAAEILKATEHGLLVEEVARGQLDPMTGTFWLRADWCREVRSGELGRLRGPAVLSGTVGHLLRSVVAVGSERRACGAGWCAKGGQRLPVWATAPAMAVEAVTVAPAVGLDT